MMEHWFWLGVAIACVLWYATITVVVAIKGAYDIHGMLRRLKSVARTTDSDVSPVGRVSQLNVITNDACTFTPLHRCSRETLLASRLRVLAFLSRYLA